MIKSPIPIWYLSVEWRSISVLHLKNPKSNPFCWFLYSPRPTGFSVTYFKKSPIFLPSIYSIHTPPEFIKMPSKCGHEWAFPTPDMPSQGCDHRFGLLKSNTILIFWNCQMCHSGPHMFIYQCLLCRRKVCRQCTTKNWSFDRYPFSHG